MNRFLIAAVALLAVPALARSEVKLPESPPVPVVANASQPKIQIAILLDTSSSMDGLINQAREQLWKVVNTFATAKRDGVRPRLEIALYEYGNDRLSAENGYIRQVSPLTTNLDTISEKLFALSTNGGSEYCGQVIQKATDQLEWSKNPHDLKLIYVAGNEPFTQGPVDFHRSVKSAVEHGIVVNTIHCGDERQGIDGQWKAAAQLADGNFLTIDQNRVAAYVPAPQDAEIAQLGAKLNQTYIGYGRAGGAAKVRQEKQDSMAGASAPGVATQRALTKGSSMYNNAEWDLVDAKKEGKSVGSMAAEELPAEMANMKPAEREAFVAAKAKERTEIQSKISTLSTEREHFLREESKKKAATAGAATLDEAMVGSVKSQGGKQAYTFE